MGSVRSLVCAVLLFSASAFSLQSDAARQEDEAVSSTTVRPIPRAVRFSGAIEGSSGQTVALTLALYAERLGGSPLWTETQNVRLDEQGRYSVLLGAATRGGLPLRLFATGEARWLGVRVAEEGAAEQPRVALVSVPYALASGDAQSLGGRPVTDFQLTRTAAEASGETQAAGSETSGTVSSGANTVNRVAKFTGVDTVGDSSIFDDGTNVGIGTTSPSEQLELTGNLRLPVATATTGIIYSGPNRLVHTVPFGSGNLFFGVNAGNLTNTGSNNVGIGNIALNGLTTGSANLALGALALSTNTTGVQNTGIGSQALVNANANNNVGIGFNALVSTTAGGGNTAVGTQAGQSNASGAFNTMLGYNSDVCSGTLSNATAVGANAQVCQSNALILGSGATVGIGTSTPTVLGGGAGLHLHNAAFSSLRMSNATQAYEFVSAANFGLFDVTGGQYQWYVSGGKLGIGTTSPTQKLEVAGTIYSTTGGFKFPDATTQTTAAVGTLTGITTGPNSGLSGGATSGSPSITLLTSCAANQILKWSGTSWACSADQSGAGGITYPYDSGNQSTTSAAFKVTQTNSVVLANDPTFAFASTSIPAAIVGWASPTAGNTAVGIVGLSNSVNSPAIVGWNGATGQVGQSTDAQGVIGQSDAIGGTGVEGSSKATTGSGTGVRGQSKSPNGVGVYGENGAGGLAGQFDGDVTVNGTLRASTFANTGGSMLVTGGLNVSSGGITVTGNSSINGTLNVSGQVNKNGGSFRIDHPLDPANKYLYHSFVESPDMMNIYNGVVALNGKGEAWITMPDWFQALNMEFRYQLTAIGRSMPKLYIAAEMSGNRFKIAGGKANSKVSWQVTGIRHDAWANDHRIVPEVEKPTAEQGTYIYPEGFQKPVVAKK